MKSRLILSVISLFTAVMVFAKDDIKRPETYNYVRGVEAVQNENYSEAYEYLTKEIAENPKNGYAYSWLAGIDEYNEDYGKALYNCDLALKYLPKKDNVYISFTHRLKAKVYEDIKEFDKAIVEYDKSIKASPEDVNLRNDRGYLYYCMDNYELSILDYKRITELEPGNVLGYLGVGRSLVAKEKYEEAILQFDYAIKLDTKYGKSYAFRAECYLLLNDWNKGTDDLISALAADRDDKAFYLMQYLSDEAFDLFITKLKIQSTKEPNEVIWHYYAGVIHERKEKYRQAIEHYSEGMKKDAHSQLAERIANCYQELGDFTEALAWTNRAMELDADDYDLVLLKANLLYDSGDINGGITELDKYVQRYPDYYFGYYRRGFFKDNAQRIDEALEDYTFAIALEPEYAYSYLGRGDIYKLKGEIEKAKIDYRKVIELDTIPSTYSCAQYAFLELGQPDKAIAFMDSMIVNEPDNAGHYYDAACLYSRMGKKDAALEFLRTACEKGYHRFAHALVDDDLDAIKDTDEFRKLIEEYQGKQNQENQSNSVQEFVEEIVKIPFTKDGGVYKVKCTINDLPLHFIFDTGATSVSLSMVEANFMMKNEYLKPTDVVGSQHFVDANGNVSEGTIININYVNFGGLELTNVRASVVRNQKAPLLLGQTVLGRLGKIEIDNENQELKITHKIKK